MSVPQLKAGDRVKWIYGGPEMVVMAVGDPDPAYGTQVKCQWFSRDGWFQSQYFPVDQLSPAGTPPPPPSS